MIAAGRAGGERRLAAASAWLEATELSSAWEAASARPGNVEDPSRLADLDWVPAIVPGTAAAALRAAGRWRDGDERDFDAEDWWFRTRFEAEAAQPGEQLMLVLGGIATIGRVYLNGESILDSDSMFAAHAIEVTDRLRASNELVIRCAALAPLLEISRRPRARWRTRLVSERNLRFFRTMLLGRAPGFAPSPAAVGPWRPVRLERRRRIAAHEMRLRADWHADEGTASLHARLEHLSRETVSGAALTLAGPTGDHHGALAVRSSGRWLEITGELQIPGATPWWPHTHGVPALYDAAIVLELGDERCELPAGRIGFRSVAAIGELERDGLRLEVNGASVFARGAVWAPPDLLIPDSTTADCRPVLEAAARAGMNMVRVPGTSVYESDAFYDACDELGILVWQDFMFANLDYPDRDGAFMETVGREARQLLERIGHRPSLCVLCGGSEVAQQAAMMGIDPQLAGGPLYEQLLPRAVDEADARVPYVPSAPWGGELPFRPDRGVANYYGVGAYLRPLEDARRAEVKFAAECLAFSNVPEEDALEEIATAAGGAVVHHPRWKAGVPRDVGAGWDFEDVRDHYLRLLFGVDPVALRAVDPDRYLDLSRQVTGEVMAEVLGEWRRSQSPCAGALILWLKDVRAGAGWGLLDHRGAPKAAYHHVRRALAPVAVWSVDEGLGGVVAHIANDGGEMLEAVLRVAMYRDLEVRVEEVETRVRLAPRTVHAENVEALLGRFVDASFAYRFGPPAQDLIVLSLEQPAGRGAVTTSSPGAGLLSQAFRLPAGRPTGRETAAQLGLTGTITDLGSAGARLTVSSRRFAYGVRVRVPGFTPEDDAFSVEPGRPREVWLLPGEESTDGAGRGHLTALNLAGRIRLEAGSG